MTRPVDALLGFLREERARGVGHVFLDEDAKEVLRRLHRASRKPKRPAAATSAPAAAPEAAAAPAPPAPATVSASGATAAERIASLREQAERWPAARALDSLRDTMVFSVGNPEAELMLVGEAPGYHEERQREPFVGPAGQKLDDILKAMGLQRGQVYISNIVKFRPAMPNQTTNNRPPTAEEMEASLPFVREEIRVVRPTCVVALGATAAKGLLGLDGAVGRMRGSWREFEGVPVRVTYHPAYLLHGSAGLGEKRKIWEDMLAVMEKLGLPISDKQRGFFLKKG